MDDGTTDPTRDTVARDAWIDAVCDRFEDDLRAGRRVAVPEFLRSEGIGPGAAGAELLRELGRLEDAYRTTPTSPGETPAKPDLTVTFESEESRGRTGVGIGSLLAGKYTLVEEIGTGGMGEVWMARQTAPMKRAVAVKVIKPGMDSRSVLDRFEAERQALAILDHPNIARVLDAGSTPGGRPFFVMELVKGVSITKFCDGRKLTPRQRLELFVPVCQAIQHAHMKGIIHRDIKPSNVLVAEYDGRAVPKVIDFGVAKATGEPLTDRSLATGLGTLVGTPEYMSPEQAGANRLDIDTRSDVYSLGVLLYELLTGTTPVDRKSLGRAALDEVLRVVREVEATRPSQKLSASDALPSIAANRSTDPVKLSRQFRGELDWVLLKALEKDRTRRYESANAFADDVQRYLEDEVVLARPPSRGYRFRKFLRKNRGLVLAASLVLAALVAGIVGTTAGLFEAERRKGEAETARSNETAQREIAEANAADADKARLAAQAAEGVAQREKRNALAVASSSTLDQAQQICEGGDVIRGLHVMAKALSPAIESGDASLEDAVRSGIAAWLPHSNRCQGFVRGTEEHFSACYRPQGDIFVTGGNGGLIEFRQASNCQKIRRDENLGSCVLKLAWQPKGNVVAILCRDGTLRLWNYDSPFANARVIRVCGAMSEGVRGGLSFSADGTKILVGAQVRSALLYNVATGEKLGEGFPHGSTHSDAVAISPDGNKVVVGTPNWSVRVYDLATAKPLTNAVRTYGSNLCAGISPDGTKFFTGHHMDASLQVWDMQTGAAVGQRIAPGGPVLSAAFSPDSQRLLVGGWMALTQIWDWKTGKSIGSPIPSQGYTTAFSPDGQSIMISTPTGTGIWKLPDRGLQWTGARLPGSTHSFTIRQDSEEFAFSMSNAFSRDSDGSQTNVIRRYRVKSGEPILPFLPSQKYGRFSISLQYGTDGKTLYCAEGNGLTLYDLQQARETERMIPPKNPGEWAYSSDGRFMASAGEKLIVYDHRTKSWSFRDYPKRFGGCVLAFIPGTHRVIECTHGDVICWDLDQSAVEPTTLFKSGMGYISLVAIRNDGQAIGLKDSAGNVNEYDLATGKLTGFSLGSMLANALHYTPDGRWLYLCDQVGAASWHPATRKKLGPYLFTGQGVPLGITPDGAHIITVDDERRLQCWRVPKPIAGTPTDVEKIIIKQTGLAKADGNSLRIEQPQPADKPALLPTHAITDYLEIHNAELPSLKKWIDTLPENFRPIHITVQEGSNGKRFDALAVDDGTGRRVEAHLALGPKEKEKYGEDSDDPAMWAKGWSRSWCIFYHSDGTFYRHHLRAKGGEHDGMWSVRDKLAEGLANLRAKRLRPIGVVDYEGDLYLHGGPDDGLAWEFHADLTAAQVQEKLAECRKRKWRPDLIHRHRTDADKFALVLIDNPRGVAWEYHVPLSVAEYEKKLTAGRAKGLRPQSVQSWLADDVPAYGALWVGDFKPAPQKPEIAPPPHAVK